jgi:hypothetical protein
MYRFTFVVYYKLKNRTLLAHLERAVVPAEVTLSFVEIQDAAEFILPKHCYAIVVTDDVRVIRSVKKEHPYIRVLYDGDWDLPKEFLEKIDQCLCVKSEILARRVFEKEVEQLACLVERYLDHDRLEALMESASDMMW